MRGFAWKVIAPHAVDKTVFDKLDETSVILPLDQLESLFAANPASTTKSAAAPLVAADASPVEVSLLDTRRSDNITIMLSKFKNVPLTQIRSALIQCDEELLPLETLQLLQPSMPTEEERTLLGGFDGDRSRLYKADRFLMEMLSIPRIDARLSSMIFRLTFEERFASAHRTVELCTASLKSIRDSASLREVLKLVLALGNYMNGGTFRGGAFGFRLNSLDELLRFKANDGKTTLLDFLAALCQDSYPHLSLWHKEVEVVCQCADVNLQQLGSDVQALLASMRVVEAELAQLGNGGALPGDALPDKLQTFVRASKAQLDALKVQSSENDILFKEVALYFGEDSITLAESSTFFGTFDVFVRSFQGAHRRLNLSKTPKKGLITELAKKQQSRQSAATK